MCKHDIDPIDFGLYIHLFNYCFLYFHQLAKIDTEQELLDEITEFEEVIRSTGLLT